MIQKADGGSCGWGAMSSKTTGSKRRSEQLVVWDEGRKEEREIRGIWFDGL